jgi:hypothetical protein
VTTKERDNVHKEEMNKKLKRMAMGAVYLTLIGPVPNKPALDARVVLFVVVQIPIPAQTTTRIAYYSINLF